MIEEKKFGKIFPKTQKSTLLTEKSHSLKSKYKNIRDLKLPNQSICFTVCVATYARSNCKTPEFLERCIDSIIKQSYQNFIIVIVGDKYEPKNELNEIVEKVRKNTKNKIILFHNDCVERDYIKDKRKLWHIAGASSMNVGLNYCREKSYNYYCHLDDDDWWDNDHLKNFAIIYTNYLNTSFVNSLSSYPFSSGTLPLIKDNTIYENNVLPKNGTMCHSSISFRTDRIPFNYFTTHDESKIYEPADGIMLDRIRKLNIQKGFSSICTNEKTCHHEIESA